MLTLLSVPQVAKRLGKDRTTIWRWVQDGKLMPAGYAGRYPLFDPATIDAIADQLKGEAAEAPAA